MHIQVFVRCVDKKAKAILAQLGAGSLKYKGLTCCSTVASGLLKRETETGRARNLDPPRSYRQNKTILAHFNNVSPLIHFLLQRTKTNKQHFTFTTY